MKHRETFEKFADRFVKREFRNRFLHEAVKKPQKLHSRICHGIEELFEKSLAGGRCSFEPSERCLVLSGDKGFREAEWAEALDLMGMGEGLLVIGQDGDRFYAESEASKGIISMAYAGEEKAR
ncbi:MAG: hypothetical protein RDV48_29955 [Candidatus Eremiobacteraeota bacterium]|nr:hypothetical protein [Candidatus Eremiobacteraeota bacterium]